MDVRYSVYLKTRDKAQTLTAVAVHYVLSSARFRPNVLLDSGAHNSREKNIQVKEGASINIPSDPSLARRLEHADLALRNGQEQDIFFQTAIPSSKVKREYLFLARDTHQYTTMYLVSIFKGGA